LPCLRGWHGLVPAPIHRNPSADAAQGPGPGTPTRTFLEAQRDPATPLAFLARGQMLERCRRPHHFVAALRLYGLRLTGRLGAAQRIPTGEMGLEVSPQAKLLFFAQPARGASPKDPELGPDRLFGVELNTVREQLEALPRAPFIERISESGPQSVSEQVEKNALVIHRSPPLGRAGVERTPKLAKDRNAPALARTQDSFQ